MITNFSENQTMNAVHTLLPFINAIMEEQVSVIFNNVHNSIFALNSPNINLVINPGQEILKGSAAYDCIHSKKSIIKVVPKELFGIAYKTISIPAFNADGTEIEGCISFVKSIEKQDTVMKMSVELDNKLNMITEAVSNISKSVQQVVSTSEHIGQKTYESKKEVENTDIIINMIKAIVSKTNLLGLNARIEATRAGEAGRGFGVVAQEIGVLSKSSESAVGEIKDKLESIKESITGVNDDIEGVIEEFNEQVRLLDKISKSTHELATMSKELKDLTQQI